MGQESWAREADRARFAALAGTHEAELGRYLQRMVGDRELARDLVQETLLSALRAWPPAADTNLRAWLYRIATNHALSHLRRRRLIAWVPLSRLLGTGREPGRASHSERVETGQAIAAALAQLAPADRACLLLDAAGFTSAELAEHLGCALGAARTRLCRARAAFRRQYQRHDHDVSAATEGDHAVP